MTEPTPQSVDGEQARAQSIEPSGIPSGRAVGIPSIGQSASQPARVRSTKEGITITPEPVVAGAHATGGNAVIGTLNVTLGDATLSAQGTVGSSSTDGDQAPVTSPDVSSSTQPALKAESLVRTLTDVPTAYDRLGFIDYAKVLANFIRYHSRQMQNKAEHASGPFVICIDAQWGGGKTSLMKMIQAELNPNGSSEFQIREFDAWLYDKEEALWAALAVQLEEQVGKARPHVGRIRLFIRRVDFTRLLERLVLEIPQFFVIFVIGLIACLFAPQVIATEEYKSLLQFVASLLSLSGLFGMLCVIVVWGIGNALNDQFFKSFKFKVSDYVRQPNYAERIGFLRTFRLDFQTLVNESRTVDGGKNPLVIFIDDLDRCSPSKAAQVVGAISSLLDAENCIYVIGMDMRTVAAAIESSYRDIGKFLDDERDPAGISFGDSLVHLRIS